MAPTSAELWILGTGQIPATTCIFGAWNDCGLDSGSSAELWKDCGLDSAWNDSRLDSGSSAELCRRTADRFRVLHTKFVLGHPERARQTLSRLCVAARLTAGVVRATPESDF